MMTFRTGLLAASLLAGSAGLAAAAPAVVASDLNLRAGPGTQYGVLAVMPAGATVNAFDCAGSWCRVVYGGISGYASASYLGTGMGAYAAAPPPVVVVPPRIVAPRPYYWRDRYWRDHRWRGGYRRW